MSKKSSYSFLEGVARAYLSRYEEMSDICFVFPNKRSRAFFLKYLSDNMGQKVMLAPEVLDISEFMGRIAGLEVASRIDLLFRLYNVYCHLSGSSAKLDTETGLLNFDRFASWGEVILGDLNEVEQYCADAVKLFDNVRDYRNLASNFLTEEQCEIIERYFGYRPSVGNVEGFWKSVYDNNELSKIKERFIELWKLLPELYEGLLADLKKDGLALQGTIYKEAAQKVMEEGRAAVPWDHVVMVGFNMLSTSEARMFDALRDIRDEEGDAFADFFWDATGPVLGPSSKAGGRAAADIRRYMSTFPMPEWAREIMSGTDVDSMPGEINVLAAPSNSSQAKIASEIVSGWIKPAEEKDAAEPDKADEKMLYDARTAIVVPDENLLLPLLHSLPSDLKSVNLTMGYSLRYTAVASFIYHFKRLQTRRRKIGGETGYYHEDFKMFLAHPLVHALIGSEKANEISSEMTSKHLRVITPAWISGYSAPLAEILEPISREATVRQTIEHLDNVLRLLDNALRLNGKKQDTINSNMERTQIATYRRSLITLLNSVMRHDISMGFLSVLHLLDRLVGGEKVNFKGKPLQGLQVMGLLETRAIDFDRLIVLSMNDKIMPRRARRRTFIPDALRRGYGLPTSSKSEDLYFYYFYRLISRAKNVNLIYDARAGEGMRSGGKSRFLMQLEMLYARGKVNEKNYTFNLSITDSAPERVDKTEDVMDRLSYFLKKDGKHLSASALMNYCSCPVKFYYKNVVGIIDDKPASEYIDALTLGQIVHNALQRLYFPAGMEKEYLKDSDRIEVTADNIKAFLSSPDAIATAVRHAVNAVHFKGNVPLDSPLEGTVAMVAERMEEQVRQVLQHDLKLAPFELVGGELDGIQPWKVGSAPEVWFRYAFDRVDRVNGKWRLVDYKSGASGVKAAHFEDVFNGEREAKYILQMLLYAHLLEMRIKTEENMPTSEIDMQIYDLNSLSTEGSKPVTIEKKVISDHHQADPDFSDHLEKIICEIFDKSKPFIPTDDEQKCSYCSFQALCGRR